MSGKKVLWLIIGAIVLFFIISQPTQAATFFGGALDWMGGIAQSIITFLFTLFGG